MLKFLKRGDADQANAGGNQVKSSSGNCKLLGLSRAARSAAAVDAPISIVHASLTAVLFARAFRRPLRCWRLLSVDPLLERVPPIVVTLFCLTNRSRRVCCGPSFGVVVVVVDDRRPPVHIIVVAVLNFLPPLAFSPSLSSSTRQRRRCVLPPGQVDCSGLGG
uniref:Uncharacterized protein n=1 Tax=Plectus sambesii TaxID=2011161 RepID=A0A914UJ55_9BILA